MLPQRRSIPRHAEGAKVDEKQFVRVEAIINSMTQKERAIMR